METWNEIKEYKINSASVNQVNLVNLKYNKNSRFEIYYVTVNLVNLVNLKWKWKFGNLAKIFILEVNLVNGVKQNFRYTNQTTNMNNFV